jgi:hypothetical protein
LRYRCPECGLQLDAAWAVTDHALYAHVLDASPRFPYPEPNKAQRRWAWIGVAGSVVVGVAFWALVVAAGLGAFDKPSAPEQSNSLAHSVAVSLVNTNAVDEYRSVEPEPGWDAEYELDDGDGVIRSRGSGPYAEVEYEATYVLEDAVVAELERRGFYFEE